jgi:hypothetical protein
LPTAAIIVQSAASESTESLLALVFVVPKLSFAFAEFRSALFVIGYYFADW